MYILAKIGIFDVLLSAYSRQNIFTICCLATTLVYTELVIMLESNMPAIIFQTKKFNVRDFKACINYWKISHRGHTDSGHVRIEAPIWKEKKKKKSSNATCRMSPVTFHQQQQPEPQILSLLTPPPPNHVWPNIFGIVFVFIFYPQLNQIFINLLTQSNHKEPNFITFYIF